MAAPTLTQGIAVLMQRAINGYLQLDPDSHARIAPLAGKVVALELRGLDITVYIRVQPGRVEVTHTHDGPTDTRISGTPIGLAGLAMRGKDRSPLFSGDVTISGDIALGQQFQALLEAVNVDWEEQLSKVVGDVAARSIGDAVRGAAIWTRETGEALTQDLTEYLREEARYLPARCEVDEFLASVDTLRNDTDRLDQRVSRLRRMLDEGSE